MENMQNEFEERKILLYFMCIFRMIVTVILYVDVDDDWLGSLNWTADVTN